MPEWIPRKTLTCWAIIKPDGHIVLDSTFDSEARAWQVVLGWPPEEEIEHAKKTGCIAKRVTCIY
jgi:hypothetical protein